MTALMYLLLQYGFTLLLLAAWSFVVAKFIARQPNSQRRNVLRAIGILGAIGIVHYHHAGYSLSWQEEIALTDGGTLWIEREVEFGRGGGDASQMNHLAPDDGGSFAFAHPTTGERIKWHDPGGLKPILLDMDGATVYLVAEPYPDLWGCPSPPYVVLAYRQNEWQRVPFQQLPKRFQQNNIISYVSEQDRKEIIKAQNRANRQFVDGYYGRRGKEYRAIDRRYTNPLIGGYCDGLVLTGKDSNGRQLEIRPLEAAYGKETAERLRQHWNSTHRRYLTDQEALELGILRPEHTK